MSAPQSSEEDWVKAQAFCALDKMSEQELMCMHNRCHELLDKMRGVAAHNRPGYKPGVFGYFARWLRRSEVRRG